ncbi:hypothetical protein DXA70_07260 [Faecalibacterium sp. OF04-11AC]|nr:hypothetical protein DXA70_07260 [Faecalibacterium sp. OF04-11AC]
MQFSSSAGAAAIAAVVPLNAIDSTRAEAMVVFTTRFIVLLLFKSSFNFRDDRSCNRILLSV